MTSLHGAPRCKVGRAGRRVRGGSRERSLHVNSEMLKYHAAIDAGAVFSRDQRSFASGAV